MKLLRLIVKNLARNKRRTILTILSTAVSVFIFCVLVAVPEAIERVLASSAGSSRLVCHSKSGLTYPLPEAYEQQIAKIAHVGGVDAWNWFGGIYHDRSDQFPNLAIEAD